MKLSTEQVRAFQALNQQERRWTYVRWLVLAFGGLAISAGFQIAKQAGGAVFSSLRGLSVPGVPSELPISMAFQNFFGWARGALLMLFGIVAASSAIALWRGDVKRKLLLSVIAELTRDPGPK